MRKAHAEVGREEVPGPGKALGDGEENPGVGNRGNDRVD